MTREEAIQYAEKKLDRAYYRLEMGYLNNGLQQIVSNEYEFFRQALSALRQQDVPDTDVGKNDPMTIDELREAAETGDPVWLVGAKSNNTQLVNGWVIIERVMGDALHRYVDYAEFGSDEPFYFKISDYGDLLKAYRHRPKEAGHA